MLKKYQYQLLLMTWSLGIEEQFYLVIPLLMVLLGRIRRSLMLPAILLVCSLSFLWACRQLIPHPGMVFYMLPSRAWELGVGVALAVALLVPPGIVLATRSTAEREASLRGSLAADVVELVQGAPELLAFGRHEDYLARADGADAELARLARRRSSVSSPSR